MSPAADRNLLFGVVALQMDFISRDALLAAMHSWVADKTKSLGEILVAQKALTTQRRDMLAALVEEHIKQHDDSPQRSLQSISSLQSVRAELLEIADSDVQASIVQIPADVESGNGDGQPAPDRTLPLSAVTSSGTRFRFLRPWREGGLGKVSVAQDEELHREVALKEIKYHHARSQQSRDRFLLEAEVTGALEHPGIVPVYGLGHYADGRPFYAMRFIRGDSLEEAIERFHKSDQDATADPGQRTVAFRELLGRFIDVCNAIAYAHSRGVLHRDLKPGNIILGKYGETLVVDWGLAKVQGKKDEPASALDEAPMQAQSGSGSAPTRMGSIVGTPAYMSPEQAEGRLDLLGPPSDVYSLGATLYCLLTGVAPFTQRDITELLSKVRHGEFPRPRQLGKTIAPPLEAICLKAMAAKPTDRYATPIALADDLEHWLADEPVDAYREPLRARTRRWGRKHRALVTGGVALLATAVVALAISTGLIAKEEAKTDRQRIAAEGAASDAELQRKAAVAAKDESDRQTELARLVSYDLSLMRVSQIYRDNPGYAVAMLEDLDRCPERFRDFTWNLMHRVSKRDRRTLLGHVGPVKAISFSPSGRLLASCGVDKTIRIWNAASGDELRILLGHTATVHHLSFSPDGALIASAGWDGTVRLWDCDRGTLIATLDADGSKMDCAVFSPNGAQLASCGYDGTIRIWNVASRTLASTLSSTDFVHGIDFSPDGLQLAATGRNRIVRVWAANTGEELFALKGPASVGKSVAFSPNGEKLVSTYFDGSAVVWDLENRSIQFNLNAHIGWARDAIYSPDGKMLATAGSDGLVKIWDASSAKVMKVLKGHFNHVESLSFSPDGTELASASVDGTIKLWGTGTREEADSDRLYYELGGEKSDSASVVYSANGEWVAAASGPRVELWDVQNRALAHVLGEGNESPPVALAFSPNGGMLASASKDGAIKLWNTQSGRLEKTVSRRATTLAADFLPDINLSSASWFPRALQAFHAITVFDLESERVLADCKLHDVEIRALEISPDGATFAAGDTNGHISIWDATSFSELKRLSGHHGWVACLRFTPDGKKIVSGSLDRSMIVWDAQSGNRLHTLRGHTNSITSIAVSPNSKTLASAAYDKTVKFWDLRTGHEQASILLSEGYTEALAFSPDGTTLASVGRGQPLRFWKSRAVD